MPQQSFDNRRTPWRITFELRENALSPNRPAMAHVSIYNGLGEVLEAATASVPSEYATNAFAEMVASALRLYASEPPRSIIWNWKRLAADWRRGAEDLAQTR